MEIGTALQAIEYVQTLDDYYEMKQFLDDWSHGNVEEWCEYLRFINKSDVFHE